MESLRDQAARRGWPLQRVVFGRFHVCDHCAHRFTTPRPHPSECPECKAGPQWIASLHTQTDADVYTPLCRQPVIA